MQQYKHLIPLGVRAIFIFSRVRIYVYYIILYLYTYIILYIIVYIVYNWVKHQYLQRFRTEQL